MRTFARGIFLFLVVVAVGCGGGSSSKKKRPPPVVQSGSVVAEWSPPGTPEAISFSGVGHVYDSAANRSSIVLTASVPLGWTITLNWPGDVNPASIDTSASGVFAFVQDNFGDQYLADATTIGMVVINVTAFASGPGGETTGTFFGEVDGLSPTDFYDLTGGTFTAERQ